MMEEEMEKQDMVIEENHEEDSEFGKFSPTQHEILSPSFSFSFFCFFHKTCSIELAHL